MPCKPRLSSNSVTWGIGRVELCRCTRAVGCWVRARTHVLYQHDRKRHDCSGQVHTARTQSKRTDQRARPELHAAEQCAGPEQEDASRQHCSWSCGWQEQAQKPTNRSKPHKHMLQFSRMHTHTNMYIPGGKSRKCSVPLASPATTISARPLPPAAAPAPGEATSHTQQPSKV